MGILSHHQTKAHEFLGRADRAITIREPNEAAAALRRMRRRVAFLIAHALALIAGQPKPVRRHKLWQRKPDRPAPPEFTSVRDIPTLPNPLQLTC